MELLRVGKMPEMATALHIRIYRCPGAEPSGANCGRPVFLSILSDQPPTDDHITRLGSTLRCSVCGWEGGPDHAELVYKHSWGWDFSNPS